MSILVKFPSRERPDRFKRCIDDYFIKSRGRSVHYHATLDEDDPKLEEYLTICKQYSRILSYSISKSTGKIHAVNRDMDIIPFKWTILVLASDDMLCRTIGWDTIIIADMKTHFPNDDGVLHYNDGHTQRRINSMCILGRGYYDRFNYIYHPSYISLWCDNEFMVVSEKLGKSFYQDRVLFNHDHPAWTGESRDELLVRNERWYDVDKQNYDRRELINFDLPKSE